MTVRERFWSKVKIGPTEKCWPWMASKNTNGYGQFASGLISSGGHPRPILAHRFALELLQVDLLDKSVLHNCDNPSCVNPGHLYLGSQADNMRDVAIRGRHHNRKISDDEVRSIRSASGTHKSIADKFGVTRSYVGQVKKGTLRRHVDVGHRVDTDLVRFK